MIRKLPGEENRVRRGVAEEVSIAFIIALIRDMSLCVLIGVYIDRSSVRQGGAKSIRFGPRIMGRCPDGSYR